MIPALDGISRLFPFPAGEVPLAGAYLGRYLRRASAKTGRPYVYANFAASLDGRIAVPPPGEMELAVPKSIANPRD